MCRLERLEDIYNYQECADCGGLFHQDKLNEIQGGGHAWDWHKYCKNCLKDHQAYHALNNKER